MRRRGRGGDTFATQYNEGPYVFKVSFLTKPQRKGFQQFVQLSYLFGLPVLVYTFGNYEITKIRNCLIIT